jgi:exosortase
MNRQVGVFAFFTIMAAILAYESLKGVVSIGGALAYGPVAKYVSFPPNSDYYSHILLIPFVSAYFLIGERKKILQGVSYSLPGLAVAAGGLIVYGIALWQKAWLGDNDFASLATAGSLIFWWGGFLLAFGPEAFRRASFPLLFLLFAIPAPEFLFDWFIYILQVGSTEVTQWLFELTGTDYIRNGFVYRLPNITIEVAKECSGIRSSIALVITAVLVGHLFLRKGWGIFVLLLTIVPFTIFKNGIRIVTLSLLSIYVDPRFITDGFLHHSGGFVFYLPALGMLALTTWWLRRLEGPGKEGQPRG